MRRTGRSARRSPCVVTLFIGALTLAVLASARPRPHPGEALSHGARAKRRTERADLAAGRSSSSSRSICRSCAACSPASPRSRYFAFPVRAYSTRLVARRRSTPSRSACSCAPRCLVAALVTVIAVVIAFFGALAFARYDWRGRRLFQKLILLPIFFPQPVLGLALLLVVQRRRHPADLDDGGFRPSGLDRAGRDAGDGHSGLWLRSGARRGRIRPRRDALAGAARDHACRSSGPASGRACCSPSCSPGAISRCRSTPPAPTATVPEWLYAKMVAGYTPMVPALGTMATLGAARLLLVAPAWCCASSRRREAT